MTIGLCGLGVNTEKKERKAIEKAEIPVTDFCWRGYACRGQSSVLKIACSWECTGMNDGLTRVTASELALWPLQSLVFLLIIISVPNLQPHSETHNSLLLFSLFHVSTSVQLQYEQAAISAFGVNEVAKADRRSWIASWNHSSRRSDLSRRALNSPHADCSHGRNLHQSQGAQKSWKATSDGRVRFWQSLFLEPKISELSHQTPQSYVLYV